MKDYTDPIKQRQFIELAIQRGLSEAESRQYLQQKIDEQQATQQPEKSFGRKALESVVEPFTKYGGFLAESVAQLGRTAFDPTIRKARRGEELTNEDIEKINQMKANIIPEEIGGFEVGLTPEQLSSPGKIAETGAKRYAGAASMLLPARKSLKGAVALGGLAGGLRSYAEDEDIAAGIVGGGVAGGALNLGGRAVGAVGRELKEGGRSLLRKVFGASGRKTPAFFSSREELLKFADDIGLQGSPTKMLQMIDDLYSKAITRLDDLTDVTPAGRPIKAATIKKQVRDEIAANIEVGTKGKERLVDEIVKKVIPYADDVSLTPDKFAQIYKNVSKNPGSRVSTAFDKLKRGGTTTSADEAWLAAYQTVTNTYKSKVNGVETVLDFTSKLHDLGTGLRKAEHLMGIKIPSTDLKVGGRLMGNVLSRGGRTAELSTGSRLVQKVAPTIEKLAVSSQPTQTLARTAGQAVATPEKPEELGGEADLGLTTQADQTKVSEDGLWEWNGATWIPTQQHLQLMAIKDYQETGGKNLSKINALGGFLTTDEENLDANTVKQIQKIEAAKGLLSVLEEGFMEAGGGSGLLTGAMKNAAAALKLDPETATYNALRDGTKAQFARAFGEVGNLTQQEQESALALIPSVTDTPEIAQGKLEQLNQVFDTIKARIKANAQTGTTGQGIGLTELGGGEATPTLGL